MVIVPDKLECEGDRFLSRDVFCTMKPLNPSGANITLGGSFTKDAENIWVLKYLH
jgi:hypothetical protein